MAFAEAISYLVLLGIAMPLKYYWDFPMAVRIVGSIHGALFVLYVIVLLRAAQFGKWSPGKVIVAFIASLLPLAPFFVEARDNLETTPNT